MTPEEQQQVNAHCQFLTDQLSIVARSGANMASQCEALSQVIKARDATIAEKDKEIAELKKLKPEGAA